MSNGNGVGTPTPSARAIETALAAAFTCRICGHPARDDSPTAFGEVRGNTARFRGRFFAVWKCSQCKSIHNLEPIDLRDIYSDYPLNRRQLDVFARGTLAHLLARLVRAGLRQSHTVLDYGCGNGLLLRYLKERGYPNVSGYDPYVEAYEAPRTGEQFDCVIANDVIEHVEDPRAMLRDCAQLVRPGGILYIGTADSEPVDMTRLEPEIMRLHQPFHRVLITEQTLHRLGGETEMELVASYRRSYMDGLRPFSNYRFLDEFNRALGHDMDRALDPAAGSIVARKPWLLFYAFFGYFFPVAWEPAIVLRKSGWSGAREPSGLS